MRFVRRLVVLGMCTAALVLGGSSMASAHAVLEHSSPADGAVLRHQPTEVTLTFGEAVGVTSNNLQVFDDRLHRVDDRDAGHLTGQPDAVGVRLAAHLTPGTYTVTWRVVSADSHPIAGGFTFSIGHPSRVAGHVAGLGGGHRSVGVLLGSARLAGYLGLLAGPGGLIFVLIWPGARDVRRLRRMIVAGIELGAVAAGAQFVLQAPYAQGESLSHLLDPSLLDAVANSHFGRVLVIRFALWLVLAMSVALWWQGRRGAAWLVTGTVLILPVTWADAGHDGTGSQVPLALVSDSLHVLAVTAWLGGLLALTAYLLRRSPDTETFAVLPRFSTLALGCVAIIVVTGLYQAWRELGLSWTELVSTDYGRLVGLKMLLLIALIGLGGLARTALRGLDRIDPATAPSDLSARRRMVRTQLRRSVFLELGLGVVVLVLTSILVNTTPGKEMADTMVHRTLSGNGLTVDLMVTPGQIGPDTISVSVFNRSGHPVRLRSASGSLGLPAHGISSLPVRLTTDTGSNRATGTVSFTLSGTWRLDVEVQTSPISATEFTTEFEIH